MSHLSTEQRAYLPGEVDALSAMRTRLPQKLFDQMMNEIEAAIPEGAATVRYPLNAVRTLMALSWWRGYSAREELANG